MRSLVLRDYLLRSALRISFLVAMIDAVQGVSMNSLGSRCLTCMQVLPEALLYRCLAGSSPFLFRDSTVLANGTSTKLSTVLNMLGCRRNHYTSFATNPAPTYWEDGEHLVSM